MPLLDANWKKICAGWSVCVGVGLSSFVVAKRAVNDRRKENRKVRERIRRETIQDFEELTRPKD